PPSVGWRAGGVWARAPRLYSRVAPWRAVRAVLTHTARRIACRVDPHQSVFALANKPTVARTAVGAGKGPRPSGRVGAAVNELSEAALQARRRRSRPRAPAPSRPRLAGSGTGV